MALDELTNARIAVGRGGLKVERALRSGVARLLRPSEGGSVVQPAASEGSAALRGSAAPAYTASAGTAASAGSAAPWLPTVEGDEVMQPSDTTCGPSAVVMARLINDPAYRASLVDERGVVDRSAFVAAVRSMHRATSWVQDHSGRWQLPWLPMLGTTPWALAHAMSGPGGAGRNGYRHRVLPFDPANPGVVVAAVTAAIERGNVVPVFVGSPAMARHVVLVTGATAMTLDLYDPASGGWHELSRVDFAAGEARVAGWTEPWFAIVAEAQTTVDEPASVAAGATAHDHDPADSAALGGL